MSVVLRDRARAVWLRSAMTRAARVYCLSCAVARAWFVRVCAVGCARGRGPRCRRRRGRRSVPLQGGARWCDLVRTISAFALVRVSCWNDAARTISAFALVRLLLPKAHDDCDKRLRVSWYPQWNYDLPRVGLKLLVPRATLTIIEVRVSNTLARRHSNHGFEVNAQTSHSDRSV